MKNSKFENLYGQILSQQKYFINKHKNISAKDLIYQSWFEDFCGAILKPIVSVGEAGISLAKGDLKGAGEAAKKMIQAPVDIVKATVSAPVELVKAGAQVFSKYGQQPDEAKNHIDEAAKQIKDEDATKFAQQYKDKIPDIKTYMQKKDLHSIKRMMVIIGISRNIQKEVPKAEPKKQDDATAALDALTKTVGSRSDIQPAKRYKIEI